MKASGIVSRGSMAFSRAVIQHACAGGRREELVYAAFMIVEAARLELLELGRSADVLKAVGDLACLETQRHHQGLKDLLAKHGGDLKAAVQSILPTGVDLPPDDRGDS